MINYDSDFEELRFILNSRMRSKILMILFNNEQNVDSLRGILDKPASTLLHSLHELILLNLVNKVGKYYYLTSRGHIFALVMYKFLSNLYFINQGQKFISDHSFKLIPKSLISEVYFLVNGEYVCSDESDFSKPLNEYLDIINKANKLNIILPIFSQIHLDAILDVIKSSENFELRLLTTNDILKSIKKSGYMRKFAILAKNHNISIWKYSGDLNVFLSFGDKFTTLSLFFNDGHFDDSIMFVEKTEAGSIWSKKLLDFYIEDSIKVL